MTSESSTLVLFSRTCCRILKGILHNCLWNKLNSSLVDMYLWKYIFHVTFILICFHIINAEFKSP
jgi:hypothetical protein